MNAAMDGAMRILSMHAWMGEYIENPVPTSMLLTVHTTALKVLSQSQANTGWRHKTNTHAQRFKGWLMPKNTWWGTGKIE